MEVRYLTVRSFYQFLEVHILTDHKKLCWMHSNKLQTNTPYVRWKYLSQFTSGMHFIIGVHNIPVDTMSRSINTLLLHSYIDYLSFDEDQERTSIYNCLKSLKLQKLLFLIASKKLCFSSAVVNDDPLFPSLWCMFFKNVVYGEWTAIIGPITNQ